MRVHFFSISVGSSDDYVESLNNEILTYGLENDLTLEHDPDRADVLVFLRNPASSGLAAIKLLESSPVIRNHSERVFTIDFDDHPEGLLAGLYTSIEQPFYNPLYHCSWPHISMNNSFVYDLKESEIFGVKSTRLFTFLGAGSHPIRDRLFDRYNVQSPLYHVEKISRWYNHGESDKRRYLDYSLSSTFCLCPRGLTSYTNRIPEVMAMGRVPVIIADDWIPFGFLDQSPYYIKILERDIDRIPEILSERLHEAEILGRNARKLWTTHCSRTRNVTAAISRITTMSNSIVKRLSFSDYQNFWHSKELHRNAGWTLRQRWSLRLEQHLKRYIPSARVPGLSQLVRNRNSKAPGIV